MELLFQGDKILLRGCGLRVSAESLGQTTRQDVLASVLLVRLPDSEFEGKASAAVHSWLDEVAILPGRHQEDFLVVVLVQGDAAPVDDVQGTGKEIPEQHEQLEILVDSH